VTPVYSRQVLLINHRQSMYAPIPALGALPWAPERGHVSTMRDWLHTYSRNCSAGASQIAPVLSNFGRMDQKIGPRPTMGTCLSVSISQRCDHLLFYAVDGHIFLLSECLHHYWCQFCQSWVQRRDPRWVHDPRRSWGIGISVGCPCHSVEFPQKHFLPWKSAAL